MPKKKTKEQFIVDAKAVHGDKYDYSLVDYINSKIKVKIICKKHGIFEQVPNAHIDRKSNCPVCAGGARKTTERFIIEAKAVHGDKYDYSLVEYVNNKTKVKVICKEHGIFTQLPADHIDKQTNCPYCADRAVKSSSQFIIEAKAVHGDKYDYSLVEYVNNKTKVKVICKEHGMFEVTPKSHTIQTSGCSICSYNEMGKNRRKTIEQFIIAAKAAHSDRYDYSLVDYVNNHTKINIICKEHGIFDQSPEVHIRSKYGCMQCWNENRPHWKGLLSEDYFKQNPIEVRKNAILYVIEMTGKSDHFIKVGITQRTIKERYASGHCGDKYLKKNIIREEPMFLYDAWMLEQKILKDLKEYQYFPNHKFNGQTECLKPKKEVLNCIENIILQNTG